MNNDIGSFIRSFISSGAFQDPESKKYFLLAYGPYMAMHHEFDTLTAGLIQDSDGQILVFRAAATLMRRLSNTTFQKAKESVRTYVMESSLDAERLKNQFDWSETNRDLLNQNAEKKAKQLMFLMRDYQYEHTLLESAMTTMAPIVPYNEEMIVVPPLLPDAEAISIQDVITEALQDDSFDSYSTLLAYAIKHAPDIVGYAVDCTRAYTVTPEMLQKGEIPATIDEVLLHTRENCCRRCDAQLYYALTALHALGYSHDQIRDYLGTILKVSSDSAVESIFDAMYEKTSTEDSLYAATEGWELLDAEKERSVEEILHKSNAHDAFHNEKHIFDLDAMMAYIYNHREIYCNTYANTFFMTEAKNLEINNLNYMAGNILLAEVNSEYLVCPFMDLTRDQEIRLLCMNKDQKIYIKDSFTFAKHPVIPEEE